MATAFRIHEDTENVTETKKEKKIFNLKNNGNDKEKRPTFAVLNNVAFDTRGTHAQKTAFNVVAAKKPIGKINDENEVPEHIQTVAIKADTKVPVDQFKAFCVYEEDQTTDENIQPKVDTTTTKDESMISVSAINISMNTSSRQPLQEINQGLLEETPIRVREILSPMSVDKSTAEDNGIAGTSKAQVSSTLSPRKLKAEAERFFEMDEYRKDILEYLKEAELRHRPKPMYMRKQPDISHSMRTILVDWLVEVCEEYRLQSETLCLAVSYIDRFLSVMSVVRAKLQLVGTAAMFIAAKYEEIYPPDVGEFVYITDNTYTKKQVLRMEQLILKVLTFDLCVPTTSIFLNAFPVADDQSKEVKFLAQYLCELSLLEAEPYLQYVPSLVSSAAIALARYNYNYPIWSRELEQLTGYKITDLIETILYLGQTHVAAVSSPQQAIQEKFKTNKYLEVSTRDPVQIDETILSRVIRQLESNSNEENDAANECNENVRKMISSLLFD